MGKVLQIRVSAETYDPQQVERHWPRLSRLAWGVNATAEGRVMGVRELIAAVNDLWKFGNEWSEEIRETVGRALPGLLDLDHRLEAALADRRPDQADALSYEIEDVLDGLERELD
ncbi:MAG TPA: hypothetical protein ENN39_08825 [Desulfonatronum sp.]|nr:hypothetical protein [Desulfonatronum sp.]